MKQLFTAAAGLIELIGWWNKGRWNKGGVLSPASYSAGMSGYLNETPDVSSSLS